MPQDWERNWIVPTYIFISMNIKNISQRSNLIDSLKRYISAWTHFWIVLPVVKIERIINEMILLQIITAKIKFRSIIDKLIFYQYFEAFQLSDSSCPQAKNLHAFHSFSCSLLAISFTFEWMNTSKKTDFQIYLYLFLN